MVYHRDRLSNGVALRSGVWGFKMNAADYAVVTSGVAAATVQWWEPLIAAVPDLIQGLILAATVTFVVFRAANEVVKFWKTQQERKRDSEE